jgi:hypothetical protein
MAKHDSKESVLGHKVVNLSVKKQLLACELQNTSPQNQDNDSQANKNKSA